MTQVLTPAPPVASITLPIGIPGFPELRELTCQPWGGEGSPFVVLAGDEPRVRFVATSPKIFFPEYNPPVPSEVRADLHLEEGEGWLLVILTLGNTPAETTANLLGPLLVNPRTGRSRQLVLNITDWSPRAPLGHN